MANNFFLATLWISFSQQGFHIVLAGCMLGLLIARAGRAWGIDALIVKCSDKRWGHH